MTSRAFQLGPIDLKLTVVKGELVSKGMEKLRRQVPLISRKRIYDTLMTVSRRMRIEEPPPVPGYTRTGMYQKGWGRPVRAGANAYKLENRVDYAVLVVGNLLGDLQRHTHWQPFRTVVDQEVSKLPMKVEDSIQLTTNAYGLG